MARRCSICAHPNVAAINHALTSRVPFRDIAGRYGLSHSSLHRHAAGHITEVMAVAAEAHAATTIQLGADLLATQREVLQAVLDVLGEGQRTRNARMVLDAAKVAAPILDRLAQLAPPVEADGPPPTPTEYAAQMRAQGMARRFREIVAEVQAEKAARPVQPVARRTRRIPPTTTH